MKHTLTNLKTWNFLSKFIAFAGLLAMTPFAMAQQAASDVVKPPTEFNPMAWDWPFIASVLLTIFVILVIARVFDIGTLTEKLTGKKVISWNKVNAWLGIIIMVAGGAGVAYEMVYHGKYVLLGDSMSEHGKDLDSMFSLTFGFTFFVFCVTEILLFWFMFRYQYKEGKKAHYYFHNNTLEVVWTTIPAVVLTFLVLRGFNTWSRITGPESTKDAQEIEVFAYQFGWNARYAGEDKKFGENHFTFISGKNPLGLAVEEYVDLQVSDLTDEINGNKEKNVIGLKQLLATVDDSAKVWMRALQDYEAKQNITAYPAVYKDLKTKAMEAKSGAYKRRLEKDIKRKETTLKRIAEFRKNKEIFNKAGNDDKVTTEIVLIKNKPYVFKFRARDVIHSAYFPDFRAQMNCVPGMSTQFAFTPVKTTAEARKIKGNPEYDFYLYCNKICGAAHYNMKIKITVVENETEYNTWLASQNPVLAPAAPAQEVAPAQQTDSTSVKQNSVATR